MAITIIIICVLLFFAGLFNGRMDHIKEFQLDKNSWTNKWKLNSVGQTYKYVDRWYYFGLHKPEYVESFPYSSTILVFTTDGWHRNKWCMFKCIELAIICPLIFSNEFPLYYYPIGIIIFDIYRGVGFNFTHKN